MKRLSYFTAIIAVICFCFSTSGCDQTTNNAASKQMGSNTEDHGHDHDGDDHGHSHGDESQEHGHDSPRGGQIIELGRDHSFHAELTDNHDDESITIYILDGRMKDKKISAETISLTLMAGDAAETFELAAGTESGKGSSYTISDETAFDMLESSGTVGKLRVTIDDKPYMGTFEHDEH